jgi:GntR family transcriptional regulator
VTSLNEIIGPLDGAERLPLYLQLQRALRSAIENRAFIPNDALPPERDLAAALSISRITVRKALDGLVGEGLLTRRQGAGTFVNERVEKSFSKLSSFSEDMAGRGRTSHSVWIARSRGAVSPEEALTLGLSPGAPVFRLSRIRYADGAPMALEHSIIPGFCLPSAEAVDRSLYAALELHNCRPTRALQRLRAVLFTAEQAALLGVEEKAAGLFIERRGFLDNGQAVEVTQSFYRGDAYDFVAELTASS